MSGPSTIKGLKKNSRSPGSIHNAEHHDWSRSHKEFGGTGVKIKTIIFPTAEVAIEDCAILRVFNDTGATAYIWIGEEDSVPGTVDATTGIAIGAGKCENFFAPSSSDCHKALMVKTSDAGVQVVVMES